jgi:multiple sugar transport system permease protein
VFGQVFISILGGYAFSRFKFPFSGAMFFLLIVMMMMPTQVTLVPNYIMLDNLGLVGNYLGLVFIGTFSAFGIFLLRQVMVGIPDEILQAAKIDGAGSWRVLWHVLLPNCMAGVASLLVLCFIDNWNMVEQPIVLLRDEFKYPLSVFLASMNSTFTPTGFVC